MSQFLPEGFGQTSPSGVADITPPDPETTSADIALMQRVLSAASRNPNLIPADFMSYLLDWIQTQRLQIPIGQVFGFTQFVPSVATVTTFETTASTSYADLATVGPTLNGLSDGQYVVMVLAAANGSAAGVDAWMSYSANGDSAVDSRGSRAATASISGLAMLSKVSLKNGNANTLQAKYRCSSGTGGFTNRCLFALKFANL